MDLEIKLVYLAVGLLSVFLISAMLLPGALLALAVHRFGGPRWQSPLRGAVNVGWWIACVVPVVWFGLWIALAVRVRSLGLADAVVDVRHPPWATDSIASQLADLIVVGSVVVMVVLGSIPALGLSSSVLGETRTGRRFACLFGVCALTAIVWVCDPYGLSGALMMRVFARG